MIYLVSMLLIAALSCGQGKLAEAEECRIALDANHLELTSAGHVQLGSLEFHAIKRAMDAVGDLRITSLEELRKRFEEMTRDGAAKSSRNRLGPKVYAMLVELADQSASCSKEFVRLWLKLHAFTVMVGGNVKHYKQLACYLSRFGAVKFARCAGQMTAELQQPEVGPLSWAEKALDDFFNQALELVNVHKAGERAEDKLRLIKLKELTFRSEQPQLGERLGKLAARWHEQMDQNKLADELLDYHSKVTKFLPGGRDLFLTINLAEALKSYRLTDDKLIKLNEYHRLACVEAKRVTSGENLQLETAAHFERLCQFVQLVGQEQLLMMR